MSAAAVFASYSQYEVHGGGDPSDPSDPPELPALVYSKGPSTLVVLTGVETGRVRVATQALDGPPPVVADGWDIVGEIDLVSVDGSIVIADWAGPAHREIPDLAGHGPGRYRVRIHARNRRAVDEYEESTEHHYLAAWPVTAVESARMLSPIDDRGREFDSIQLSHEPWISDTDEAAIAAIEALAVLVNAEDAGVLSGTTRNLTFTKNVGARRDRVQKIVAAPWTWFGNGGWVAGFDVILSARRRLFARGTVLVENKEHVAYTWAWHGYMIGRGWHLPEPPITISINLAPAANGSTDIAVLLADVPLECADMTQAIWGWAMDELAAKAPRAASRREPPWGH